MDKNIYDFVAQVTNDPIVQRVTCAKSGVLFPIYKSDQTFLDKMSPIINGQKYSLPLPTLAPQERQKRRLSFRNERKLYRRSCDKTGKPIISIYSPDKPYTVYDQKARRADDRNPLEYGQDFDFTKPFFEQFDALKKRVPHISLHVTNNENAEYVNLSGYNKNSYLLAACEYDEECMYSTQLIKSVQALDCLNASGLDNCYQCINCDDSYNLFFSINTKKSNNSYFLQNSEGCSFCIGCINLINKSYCIFNQQYSKEQFIQQRDLLLQDIGGFRQRFQEFAKTQVHPALENSMTDKSIGNYLFESKDIVYGFDVTLAEDCRYVYTGYDIKSLMDVCHTTQAEHAYEAISIGYVSQKGIAVNGMRSSNNCYYSDNVHNSSFLFGCIGLRNQQYCIFNKQYTAEEREKQVAKIITHMQSTGEWGQFFPSDISPFGYNETVAYEYFPLTQEQAEQSGYKRQSHNYDSTPTDATKTIQGKDIQTISQHDDEQILSTTIMCSATHRPFKIQKQELIFYRKHNLPLPEKHPDARHLERMQQRLQRELYLRECNKTHQIMISTYTPNTPFPVYSPDVYNQEIYG